MKYLVPLAWLLLATPVLAWPQKKGPDAEFKKNFNEAIVLLYEENYSEALPILLKLDSTSKANANLSFYIGYCYLNSATQQSKAIPYLEYASEYAATDHAESDYRETRAPLHSIKILADAYHVNYQFGKAITTYELYTSKLDSTEKEELTVVERQINISKTATRLVEQPVEMITTNLGITVNSRFPEYSPVITADESVLIYTSRREGSTGEKLDAEGLFYEDIYMSENIDGKWSNPKKIGETVNTDGHEAPTGLSADGQMMLIYKFGGGGTGGDILFSKLEGETWSEPQKFGSEINTPAWESHATISANNQLLSFTSDREGGLGGRDIWFCKRLPTGDWARPQNYGPVMNTPYDEGSPFLHPDGKTLYFSSRGHNTMGGFDIFYSELQEDGTWGKPVNMGYPVNTTGDDTYYMPTTDGKGAYYASFRNDGQGEKDIYKIDLPQLEAKRLTVYTGKITNRAGKVPQDVYIEVTDNESGELIGTYLPNSATGKYLFILKPGHNYNITYESKQECYYHSENMIVPNSSAYQVINRPVTIDPLKAGIIVRLNNIFYEFDKAILSTPESLTELDKIHTLMTRCPNLLIEISGHTDSKGTDAYNLKLSQARCQSVVDYLTDKGITMERLVPKGYGETQPIGPNEHPDGSDNEEGRALNRRTELKVL